MFAAGRAISGADDAACPDERGGDEEWLKVGRSFQDDENSAGAGLSLDTRDDTRGKKKQKRDREEVASDDDRSRALVVHKRHRSKAEKHSKTSKKKSKEDKKSKKKKKKGHHHHRSEYSSASWDESDSSDYESERRLTRRCQLRSRSRSVIREHQLATTGPTRDLARSQPSSMTTIDVQEKLFEVDRVGDRDNQFFGSIYSGDQPLYELATRRALGTGAWIASSHGLPSSVRAEARRKREDERQKAERYFGLDARRAERLGQQRRLYLAYSDKRRGRQLDSQLSTATEMAYIPLDPVVDADVIDAVETEDGTMAANGDIVALTDAQNAEQLLMTRTKLFNAMLAENPHNVGVWLDFMAFQDQTLQLVQGKDKKALAAAQRSVFDKQALILEKAIALNPNSRELQRVKINLKLHMSRLQDSGDDHDAALQLLESLIEHDPTDPALWIKLLECHQQNFSSFSVPSIRNLFARILAVYRKQRATADGSAETDELLSDQLVRFHELMCAFEHKTGHLEHAIAHLQALFDFNFNAAGSRYQPDDLRPHHELLDEFADRWSQDIARLGDIGALSDEAVRRLLDQGVLPADFELNAFVESECVTQLREINPPNAIRSRKHKQQLLSSSAAYRRRVSRLKGPSSGVNGGSQGSRDDSSYREGESHQDGGKEREGRLVYSNLHGYRILVDEANDAAEYERILSELRGTEASQARQEQLAARDEERLAGVVAAVEEIEDQRADYDGVSRDDPFVAWLASEEVQEQTQWHPLWATREDHQGLIEAAPERAVLTDELQPFLFKISPSYQWTLISDLLEMCGVHTKPYQDSSIYADAFSVDCGPLAKPLLRALDSNCRKPLAMTSQDRLRVLNRNLVRCVRVEKVTALDRDRVTFIRQIFAQSLKLFQGHVKVDSPTSKVPSSRMIKWLWIGFEADLSAKHSKFGTAEDIVVFARSVSQLLLQDQSSLTTGTASADQHADLVVLSEYAQLEYCVGNDRQVHRIFEKTLSSLRTTSSIDRDFHRLVFLRARQELWGVSKSNIDGKPTEKKTRKKVNTAGAGFPANKLAKLRTLYILWCVWQPAHESLDSLVKALRKDPAALVKEHLQHLEESQVVVNLEATYRSELDYAIRESASSCACCLPDASDTSRCSLALTSSPSCVVGYCVHNLALVVYCSRGLEAACDLYREFLRDDIKSKPACLRSRWVWLSYLELMQQHQNADGAFPPVSPRMWRTAVEHAVQSFPHDALLLRLFIDAETGAAMSQALRSHFLRVEKQSRRHFDSPKLAEWLFTLLAEITRIERAASMAALVSGGSSEHSSLSPAPESTKCCLFHKWGANAAGIARVRATFENMVSQVRTRGCALAWRLYVRFEVALGRVDAAKKVFYRALARCPWSKALYTDGVRLLRPYLSEEECQEVLDFMTAKELHVRVEM